MKILILLLMVVFVIGILIKPIAKKITKNQGQATINPKGIPDKTKMDSDFGRE